MSVFTSTHFASSIAAGTDWRDCSKAVLEQLEDIRTEGDGFNFGFLYVSDLLAGDLDSILNLFRSVMDIENWTGCIGIGVCGNHEQYVDTPAISAMITRFDDDQFQFFGPHTNDISALQNEIQPWLNHNMPMLTLVHADPMVKIHPEESIKHIANISGGYVIGGLSSSRHDHTQIAQNTVNGGTSGVVFSSDIKLATTLSQACKPVGELHTITKGQDHIIYELDDQKALEVFDQDLKTMVVKRIDRDPDQILINENALQDIDSVPEEYRHLFEGEMHVAFSNVQADTKNYLVRNIVAVDQENGAIAVSQHVNKGEHMMFVKRSPEILKDDLVDSLNDLKERIIKDEGEFKPKGALYISCIARGVVELDGFGFKNEMDIIHSIIGDVPLTGFFAAGEISNARLYGFTGILTLFL